MRMRNMSRNAHKELLWMCSRLHQPEACYHLNVAVLALWACFNEFRWIWTQETGIIIKKNHTKKAKREAAKLDL